MGNLKSGGKGVGGSTDPMFGQYLSGITGTNIADLAQTYKNLGLDTSGSARGMSPQESKDIGWLQQAAQGVGTQGFLQNAPNITSNINAQNQQTAQNISQAGQAGGAAGTAAGAGLNV